MFSNHPYLLVTCVVVLVIIVGLALWPSKDANEGDYDR